MSKSIDRRQFIAGTGAGLAAASALASAACADSAQAQGDGELTWDYEADVVIVGAGGAGEMAALAASELGASSLILEKASFTGGDTALANGGYVGFCPRHAKEVSGIDDTLDSWLADQQKSNPYSQLHVYKGEGVGDLTLVRRQGELMEGAVDWLEENAGIEFVPFNYCFTNMGISPGWDTVYPRDWSIMNGVMTCIDPLVEADENIEVVTSARVYEIVMGDDGRAIGVRAMLDDGLRIAAKASRAVILATGSFNGDKAMMEKYIGRSLSMLASTGRAANTGDGHKMAEQVGARLVGMDIGSACFNLTMRTEHHLIDVYMMNYGEQAGVYPSGILVNLEGKRYANENLGYNLGGRLMADQPSGIGFYILDDAVIHVDDEGSLLVPGTNEENEYILKADTLEELASLMHVPADAFVEQVETYNGYVDAGEDPDFGKVLTGCQRIEVPPFYAMPLQTQHYVTYGGIAVDTEARVLDHNGEPIPGLYAAGLCTGSFAEEAGLFYLGGLSQCLPFGRLSGQNAAQETPWC